MEVVRSGCRAPRLTFQTPLTVLRLLHTTRMALLMACFSHVVCATEATRGKFCPTRPVRYFSINYPDFSPRFTLS